MSPIQRHPVEEMSVEAGVQPTPGTLLSKLCTLAPGCVSWKKRVFRENNSNSSKGFTGASSDAGSLPQVWVPAALFFCIRSGLLSWDCFSLFALGLLEKACCHIDKCSLEQGPVFLHLTGAPKGRALSFLRRRSFGGKFFLLPITKKVKTELGCYP